VRVHNETMDDSADTPNLTGMLKVLRDAHGPLPRPYYQSYLLRLWREQPKGPWRISLENVSTGKRHKFSGMEAMLAFLESPTAREEAGSVVEGATDLKETFDG
jgi:hypothetical protein